MGIATVAVHSQADKESLHVSLADESVCVGKALPGESYLRQKDIITAALLTGAQAIHPGYGFLAENADFARLCEKNGLVFIGPSADVISQMGDKDAARRLMKNAGVPTVPGTDILISPTQAAKEANRIGYPVLIKARAGGGGKGIRLVNGPDELENAFLTASEEAKNAFGDGGVYMEKYLSPVKHIEVQLLADEGGSVVCLGERECSIQKRNQSFWKRRLLRRFPWLCGKKCAKRRRKRQKPPGYTNAGTVEFLLDDEGNFYFMEMNTRLQVEHPVSEYVSAWILSNGRSGLPVGFF